MTEGPLLAYVRRFAGELAGYGVVMGSKVAEELVAGAESAAVRPCDQGRATSAARMLPLTADPGPEEPAAVTDARGVYWSSPAAALTVGVLGLCGCGYGESFERDVTRLLVALPGISDPHRPLPELVAGHGGELYRELLLHLLTDAGLLEHGTSVTGSWRTELGDRWVEALP